MHIKYRNYTLISFLTNLLFLFSASLPVKWRGDARFTRSAISDAISVWESESRRVSGITRQFKWKRVCARYRSWNQILLPPYLLFKACRPVICSPQTPTLHSHYFCMEIKKKGGGLSRSKKNRSTHSTHFGEVLNGFSGPEGWESSQVCVFNTVNASVVTCRCKLSIRANRD